MAQETFDIFEYQYLLLFINDGVAFELWYQYKVFTPVSGPTWMVMGGFYILNYSLIGFYNQYRVVYI